MDALEMMNEVNLRSKTFLGVYLSLLTSQIILVILRVSLSTQNLSVANDVDIQMAKFHLTYRFSRRSNLQLTAVIHLTHCPLNLP